VIVSEQRQGEVIPGTNKQKWSDIYVFTAINNQTQSLDNIHL